MLDKYIHFFLENKLIAALLALLFIGWGIAVAPFDWDIDWLPRDPIHVDALPNLGKNQQIVYTKWPGRSPQDIEDQITYPLTTQLLNVPGVQTIRSSSMMGTSYIYIIFEEDIEFYWSRARILEKLNSLPAGTLPGGVQPRLGPDATALGQVFWYTLEGRDKQGNPTGGWSLQELRSIQDFYVGYALSSASGVAEVAPAGGYVKEYQVDVDPAAMKIYDVSLTDVFKAVKESNAEVGARTIELNNVEYLVRGLGYVNSLEDLEKAVVAVHDNVPIQIEDVANVNFGPAPRRGALDKGGAEVVGGVVVARYGENPLEVINNVKEKIKEISPGLPTKTLNDGTVSQVTIVPFYDRSELIHETLGTLEEALMLEMFITIIVIVVMVLNLRTSFLISAMLPLAVLMSFIMMKLGGINANIVSLTGIAIAIGVIVDMGIVLSENILQHMERAGPHESLKEIIFRASSEVSHAIVTAITTTIVSFLPIFTMVAAEGKLFKPLAFTKTFAMVAAMIIVLTLIPPFAHWFFSINIKRKRMKLFWNGLLILGGFIIALFFMGWAGLVLLALGVVNVSSLYIDEKYERYVPFVRIGLIVFAVTWLLSSHWLLLGPGSGFALNFIVIALLLAVILGSFWAIIYYYRPMLRWCLQNKAFFLSVPAVLTLWAVIIWLGFASVFGFVANGFDEIGINIRETGAWTAATETLPGLGEEFMPDLDEGSFLLMPTTMPHVGVEQSIEYMQMVDMAVAAIPEVEHVVGKMGRAQTALDPAPVSMYEILITYKTEYKTNEEGDRIRFRVSDEGEFVRGENGQLIADSDGRYYRQWRSHIHSPDDIWQEIVEATDHIPGLTSAPKLQPIQVRQIMQQSGMRAPLGIKIKGSNLETMQAFGFKLENLLKQVPGIEDQTVFANRLVGKPYLEIKVNRNKIARYGLSMADVQRFIKVALGGIPITKTVEGRERYTIRVRYAREFRNEPSDIRQMLVTTKTGNQVPLGQLAEITYRKGPQMIKSEDTFLVNYVIFGKQNNISSVEVVENAKSFLRRKVESGELIVPAGISYTFAGSYQNQLRASKHLSVILPITLLLIFLIIYFQFRSVSVTSMIFSSVFVAWAGGFILLWLYGQPWFMDVNLFGQNLRNVFQIGTVNLSIAVWVGFLVLFGVATEGAVVMAAYLDQVFDRDKPKTTDGIQKATMEAAGRRIRPTMMTTATTILALIPVLTATGRGSDIMVPMAIPSVGGMFLVIISLFIVPVLYAGWKEWRMKRQSGDSEIFTTN